MSQPEKVSIVIIFLINKISAKKTSRRVVVLKCHSPSTPEVGQNN